jgi:hypothetical protein
MAKGHIKRLTLYGEQCSRGERAEDSEDCKHFLFEFANPDYIVLRGPNVIRTWVEERGTDSAYRKCAANCRNS